LAENGRKLLTIVTETAIEQLMLQDLESLGAHGYTVTEARGKGARGVRSADWGTNGNIRVEIVCDAQTCERLVKHLQERYYPNYAMILFVADVSVLRPGKF